MLAVKGRSIAVVNQGIEIPPERNRFRLRRQNHAAEYREDCSVRRSRGQCCRGECASVRSVCLHNQSEEIGTDAFDARVASRFPLRTAGISIDIPSQTSVHRTLSPPLVGIFAPRLCMDHAKSTRSETTLFLWHGKSLNGKACRPESSDNNNTNLGRTAPGRLRSISVDF